MRSRSSAAAASVNVMAARPRMSAPFRTRLTMRPTSAVVFPVPAPASTNSVVSSAVRISSRAAWSAGASVTIDVSLSHGDIGVEHRRRLLAVPVNIAVFLAERREVAEAAVVPPALPRRFARPGRERPGGDAVDDDLHDLAEPCQHVVGDRHLVGLV